jgi:phosphoesterase RecJ-like protein
MVNEVFEFLERHSSLILTTHDNADADGLGAEKLFAKIAISLGKKVRIINSNPIPEKFQFLDPENAIETWDKVGTLQDAALVMLDTSDEYNIGQLRELIFWAAEVFAIDHHEPGALGAIQGCIDPTASSASEMIVEMALEAGTALDAECAAAAYAGIVYDTGFFAYPKTTIRTFRAALALVEAGVNPNAVYRELNEKSSITAVELQKTVLSTLEIHNKGRVAAQMLRKEDLIKTGAHIEDAENFINIPMRCREIEVSVVVKENKDGQVRCSLRSKGKVNVSKIAQSLGGGGHITAAGFKSKFGLEETLGLVLEKINEKWISHHERVF